jgi:hypothetical protein
MNTRCKAVTLSVLLLTITAVFADDTPTPAPAVMEEKHPVTLEEVVTPLMQDSQIKVLLAKTELIEGKKIHIIKLLIIATGYIQHVKVDASSGKILETFKK